MASTFFRGVPPASPIVLVSEQIEMPINGVAVSGSRDTNGEKVQVLCVVTEKLFGLGPLIAIDLVRLYSCIFFEICDLAVSHIGV